MTGRKDGPERVPIAILSLMDILATVKQAINALSSHSETAKANEWLVEFEKSQSAWTVSDQLIAEEKGSPYRFFGAKFLYSKVQRQFYELSAQSAQSLITSLVQHVLRLAMETPVEYQVIRYLSLAIAALAIQLNQSGVVNHILNWLNPVVNQSPGVLLILLTFLPEEVYNRSIETSPEIRDAFLSQLTHSSEDVMQFLVSLWPKMTTPADRCKILKCLENWIDIVDINSSILYKHSILQMAIEILINSEGEVFEAAVDLMIVLFKRYYHSDASIAQHSLPHILSLQSKWSKLVIRVREEFQQQHHTEEDDEIDEMDKNEAFALCRLFTEVAETAMSIFSNHYQNYGQDILLNVLLECASFTFDHNIARIPLKFFYDLSLLIKPPSVPSDTASSSSSSSIISTTMSTQSSSVNNEAEGRMMYEKYHGVYERLLGIAISNIVMCYSSLTGSTKLSDTKLEIRSEWRDTILDASFVLTSSKAIAILLASLEGDIKELSKPDVKETHRKESSHQQLWCHIESILLAIYIILPKLSKEGEGFIPQLIAFLCTLPKEMLNLQITVIDLLGGLASHLHHHTKYITVFLDKLLYDLSNQKTSLVASKAMMSILKHAHPSRHHQQQQQVLGNTSSTTSGSGEGLSPAAIMDLHEKVISIRNHHALSLEAELNWLEGMAVAMSHMQPNDSLQAITLLLQSNLQLLQQAIQQQQNTIISQQMDRISILVKHYHHDAVGRDYIPMMLNLFLAFDNVIHLLPTEHISEKICRCYRFTMKYYTYELIPHLSKLMELISLQFQFYPVSSFLYAASTVIATFALLPNSTPGATAAVNSEIIAPIYQMIWQLSSIFFSHYSSLQHFMNKPDVVEEYYYMLAKLLQYIPAPFLENNANTNTILQAAIMGLALEHREAQKGILLFCERYIEMTTFWTEDNPMCGRARQVVLQDTTGGLIVQGLFGLLCGKLPAYAIDESNGCIADVLWLLKRKFSNDLKVGKALIVV